MARENPSRWRYRAGRKDFFCLERSRTAGYIAGDKFHRMRHTGIVSFCFALGTMLNFVFKRARATARICPEDCERYLGRLVFSMETRELYRNADLTLEELALAVAMTPQQLSQLLKEACGSSFQDYLNGYRVEALKAALLCPKNAGENVFDLALACGFSTRTGLNRLFRKYTGVTPEQFRKQGGAHGAAGGSSFATQ